MMTKEELKEAIASTIIENNQKGITATALANLLNEIVDAAGGSAGGLTLTAGMSLETFLPSSDPNEANALCFRTIMEGAANGVGYPVTLLVDYSFIAPGMFFSANIDMMMPNDDFSGLYFESTLLSQDMGVSTLTLYEDGSISVEEQETSGE
jgi:hypothetical protein